MFIELNSPFGEEGSDKRTTVNVDYITQLEPSDESSADGTVFWMEGSQEKNFCSESYEEVKEILGFVRDNVWSTD